MKKLLLILIFGYIILFPLAFVKAEGFSLSATVSSNTVRLQWSNPPANTVAYILKRQTVGGMDIILETMNGTNLHPEDFLSKSYTDSNVPDGQYTYLLKALDSTAAIITTVNSNQVTVGNPDVPNTLNLSASADSPNKKNVVLSWDKSKAPGANKFTISRDGSKLADKTDADAGTYTDNNVPNGEHTYKVEAFKSDGTKVATGIISIIKSEDGLTITDASADSPGHAGPTETEFGPVNTLGEYLTKIFTWVTRVAFLLAILMSAYAGYLYMSSQGNPEGINQAKDILIGVVTGVILLFLIEVILVSTIGLKFQF